MRLSIACAVLAAAGLLATLLPASAEDETGCAAFKWSVKRERSAFAADGVPTVQAGAQIPGIMEAVTLKLAKQAEQTFAVPPTHSPKNRPAFAGAFPVPPILVAGPYEVTISAEAWIDVIQDGKTLHPTGFTGAKDCSGVRKSVRFDLAQGPATIMVTDAATDSLKLELLPPPPQ